MVRFCFASVYGAFRLAKLRESCFIFRNHVVLAVLIFLSYPKNISDRICKKTDSQVYAFIELRCWVNTL